MSIRLKLILTYFFIIALSLGIFIGGLFGITTMFISDAADNVMGDKSLDESVTAAFNALVDIEYTNRHEPDMFYDETYASAIERTIKDYKPSMYIVDGDQMIYKSVYSPEIPFEQFYQLIEYDKEGHNHSPSNPNFDGGSYTYEDVLYIVMRQKMPSEETPDYVYLVFKAESNGQLAWNLYGGFFRFLFVILLVVLLVLTIFVGRQIIRPLNELERATNEIRQGNLNFEVNVTSKDEFGRVLNTFDTMRDELKLSIEQQIQYEENRKELIASISHDLKTPITSIKGYVEGIRDGVAQDQEKVDQYLEVIYHKSVDMDKLIDDLFLFSKLDLNRMPFEFSEVSAKSFFDDSGDEIAMDIGKLGFQLNFRNDLPKDWMIKVDQQQFRRVITNVVSNAIKYSPDGDRVDMTLLPDGDKVKVKIKDYGKGIDPESLEKIFDKFYRADPSRNTAIGGSGLGLAIAKEIIDRHEGTITAESTLGKGTTITITIGRTL